MVMVDPELSGANATVKKQVVLGILAILFVQAVVAIANGPSLQVGVFTHLLRLSEYFQGGPRPSSPTYPMWGYAWLLCAVRPISALMLQCLLGAVAAGLLLARLRQQLASGRRLLVVLFLVALPWYTMHSYNYASSFAVSFCLLAILALERALARCPGRTRWAWAVAAGCAFGLSQNFRSEYVALPGFLVVTGLVVNFLARKRVCAVKPMLVAAVIALLFQIPWGLYYQRETGRFSLTESNRGHVAFVSLGNLPGNPWGIISSDRYAQQIVEESGGNFSSVSDRGDALLWARFLAAVREHPGAFVAKLAFNTVALVVGGFGNGRWGLREEDELRLDVFRERLKLAIRLNPNLDQIESYKSRGQWEQGLPPGLAFYAAFAVAFALAGAVFMTLAISGLALSAIRLRTGESILFHPLLVLLGGIACFRAAVVIGMYYLPIYMNDTYLAWTPFVVISGVGLWRRFGRVLGRGISGTSCSRLAGNTP